MNEKDNNGQFLVDDFAPESEKTTDEYAVALMNRFWTRWGGWTFFDARVLKYREIRAYAEGVNQVQELIDQTTSIGEGGQPNSSWANLDYTPPAILPIFVDGVVGDFMGRKYRVSCKAADGLSQSKKLDAKNKELNLLKFKDLLKEIENTTGIPTPKPKFETEEEIDVEYDNFKLGLEEAIEVSVQNIFEQNNIESIERQMWYDFVNLKMAVVRCYYDINWKVKFEYIDPALYLCTTSLKEDYSDVNCEGHLEMVTVGELKRQSGWDNERLYGIACKFAGKLGNAQNMVAYTAGMPDVQYTWFSNLVMVFHYRFKSIDTTSWKSVKTFRGKTRILKGDPKNETDEIISKDIENLYEGTWVVGSQDVYKHRKCKNMIRPRLQDAVSTQVQSGYFKFAPNIKYGINKSHTERAIMFAKQWHLAFLKLQQFLMKAIPPGYKIDINGLTAVDIGGGKTEFPHLSMKIMHEQTGVYIYDSGGEGGLEKNGKAPLEPFVIPIGEIERLMNACNFFLEAIRQVFGRPQGVDTSTPNPETAVGVTNAVTRAAAISLQPLRQGFTNIMKGSTNYICMMLQDRATDKESMAIGDLNVKLLEMGKDLENATLGIDIEYDGDEQEKQEIRMTLDYEVKAGTLRSEDALYIKTIQNVKQQARVMSIRRKQYAKQRMEEAAFNSEQQSKGSVAAAQAAEQARAQTELAILEQKKQLAMIEGKNKESAIWTQAYANIYEKEMALPIEQQSEDMAHVRTLAEMSMQQRLKPQPSA